MIRRDAFPLSVCVEHAFAHTVHMSEATDQPGFVKRVTSAAQGVMRYLRRAVTQPVGELERGQQWVRYTFDLSRHCVQALKHDRAAEMAAALTYRTVFSIVPVTIVALILIKSFSGVGDLRSAVLDDRLQQQFFDYVGLDIITGSEGVRIDGGIEITPDDTDATGDDTDAKVSRGTIDKSVVDKWAAEIADRIGQVSFTSIGIVGVILLIWAALGLAVTIENTFNRVYNCPTGRPWVQRITIYWSVLTLAPLLTLLSVTAMNFVVVSTEGISVLGWLWRILSPFASLLATWALLFLLFVLMPNTKVRRRPALVGSLIAAILWELAKWGFKLYVTRALFYSALYGSLALIPIFLLWLYLTWVIILFGLELTYTLQAMRGRKFKYDRDKPQDTTTDPYWVLPIIVEIARRFMAGESVGRQRLSDRLSIPVRAVAELSQKLEQAGLIHTVQVEGDGDSGYAMSLPPDRVPVAKVLEVAQSTVKNSEQHRSSPGWAYLDAVRETMEEASEGKTLQTLLQTPVKSLQIAGESSDEASNAPSA